MSVQHWNRPWPGSLLQTEIFGILGQIWAAQKKRPEGIGSNKEIPSFFFDGDKLPMDVPEDTTTIPYADLTTEAAIILECYEDYPS